MALLVLHANEIKALHAVYQRSGLSPVVVPVDRVRVSVRMRRVKEFRVGYNGPRVGGLPVVVPHFGTYPDRESAQQFIDLYLGTLPLTEA